MSRTTRRPPTSSVRRPAKEFLLALLVGLGIGAVLVAAVFASGIVSGGGTSSAPSHPTAPGDGSTPHGQGGKGEVHPATARGTSRGSGTTIGSSGVVRAPSPVLDATAASSFKRLVSELPGRVELALAPLGGGSSETLGGDAAAHGWSTTKVPVLVALLKARGEDLTAEERAWAQSAITESNNESVLDLFREVEQIEGGLVGASEYVQELLRSSGDEETVIATAPPPPGAVTTFGQTEWRPGNAVKFFSALARGCLLPPRGTNYVLDLMRHIEPSESWGLGSAGLPRIAFKGGWGPEPGGTYLVRQSGIVDAGSSKAVAVAIVAFPPAGSASFETGSAMLTDVARWLREHLLLVPRASVPCA